MRHPAENYIKFLILKHGADGDGTVMKMLERTGFLSPEPSYVQDLRQELNASLPAGFDPDNRLHRPTMKYLRKHGVYELFFQNAESAEALGILSDPTKRLEIEKLILARLDKKAVVLKINKLHNWHLTAAGVEMYEHFFWNYRLLTWDDWGRFLYKRSGNYGLFITLLRAGPDLAFHHLGLEQAIESKQMIQRAQRIAYFTLEEVAQQPGTQPDKVKAVGILTKALIESHEALSTSDMALKDVLKGFERFRMTSPEPQPPDIKELAPSGNYSDSGKEVKESELHVETE